MDELAQSIRTSDGKKTELREDSNKDDTLLICVCDYRHGHGHGHGHGHEGPEGRLTPSGERTGNARQAPSETGDAREAPQASESAAPESGQRGNPHHDYDCHFEVLCECEDCISHDGRPDTCRHRCVEGCHGHYGDAD